MDFYLVYLVYFVPFRLLLSELIAYCLLSSLILALVLILSLAAPFIKAFLSYYYSPTPHFLILSYNNLFTKTPAMPSPNDAFCPLLLLSLNLTPYIAHLF